MSTTYWGWGWVIVVILPLKCLNSRRVLANPIWFMLGRYFAFSSREASFMTPHYTSLFCVTSFAHLMASRKDRTIRSLPPSTLTLTRGVGADLFLVAGALRPVDAFLRLLLPGRAIFQSSAGAARKRRRLRRRRRRAVRPMFVTSFSNFWIIFGKL